MTDPDRPADSATPATPAHDFAPWLGSVALGEFRGSYFHRAPLAQAGTTHAARPLMDWDAIDQLLRAEPDVMVVAGGKLLPLPPPRSLAELRGYLAAGIGLCIRRSELHSDGLARLAGSFGELGTAHVQVFVTRGGTHGFGWHYDDEDVFIAQTHGVKDYYFRANTVAADEAARPEMFTRFSTETSQLCAATLVPGDFLYIPARWWHMAVCKEDALSISVGLWPTGREPIDPTRGRRPRTRPVPRT